MFLYVIELTRIWIKISTSFAYVLFFLVSRNTYCCKFKVLIFGFFHMLGCFLMHFFYFFMQCLNAYFYFFSITYHTLCSHMVVYSYLQPFFYVLSTRTPPKHCVAWFMDYTILHAEIDSIVFKIRKSLF